MANSNGIVIWTFLLTITGAVVSGQTGPNAVALINGQTSLDCFATAIATSLWIRTTDGTNNPLSIATNCSVSGSNAAYYRTEQPGGNVCRLIIANATMQLAGVYTCFDGTSNVFRSLITIIDPNAIVVFYKQSEVVVGDQLNISCSINYNGPASPAPSLRPSPYWTTSPGQTFNSATYYPSTTVVTLVATVTAQKPTVPAFQCNTVFEITGNTSGYNPNPPSDNLRLGATTQIDVLFNASTPNIERMQNTACGSIALTCNSSGYPQPNYRWFGSNDSVNLSKEKNVIISIDLNRVYVCEAYNTIRNVTHYTAANYSFSENDGSPKCNKNPIWTTNILTTIILAAVLGGYGLCNIIATIAFLEYYNRKSNDDGKDQPIFKNKQKLNARFPWLQHMLPCMNNSEGKTGCPYIWVVLFLMMSILVGILVFPILVAIVNCFTKHNNLTGNSEFGMSNTGFDGFNQGSSSSNHKAATTSSTAVHGDIENNYASIGTVIPKNRFEEPTSGKNINSKETKKVFYTKVNPSTNIENDIERYSVSPPKLNVES